MTTTLDPLVTNIITILTSHGITCTDADVTRFVSNQRIAPKQQIAQRLLTQHLHDMERFASCDVVLFIQRLFDEGYKDIWPYLFGTSDSDTKLPNGKITGTYLEEMVKAIARGALYHLHPAVEVASAHPNTDVSVHLPTKFKISLECKGQSDKTSFRNALSHIRENYNTYDIVGAVFRTTQFLPHKKTFDTMERELAALPGATPALARSCVSDMYTRKCGVFRLTPKIIIVAIGTPSDEFKKWNGESYTNHGGAKAWKLSPTAVQELVDYFVEIAG